MDWHLVSDSSSVETLLRLVKDWRDLCQSCVDPVLMIGSDLQYVRKGDWQLIRIVGRCGIGSRGFAMD